MMVWVLHWSFGEPSWLTDHVGRAEGGVGSGAALETWKSEELGHRSRGHVVSYGGHAARTGGEGVIKHSCEDKKHGAKRAAST